MQGKRSENNKKINWWNDLEYIYEHCVKIWKGENK